MRLVARSAFIGALLAVALAHVGCQGGDQRDGTPVPPPDGLADERSAPGPIERNEWDTAPDAVQRGLYVFSVGPPPPDVRPQRVLEPRPLVRMTGSAGSRWERLDLWRGVGPDGQILDVLYRDGAGAFLFVRECGRSTSVRAPVPDDLGDAPGRTIVPTLVGADLSTARARLATAGLRVGRISVIDDGAGAGSDVTVQVPEPGQSTYRETAVDIALGGGPPMADTGSTGNARRLHACAAEPQTPAGLAILAGTADAQVRAVRAVYEGDEPAVTVPARRRMFVIGLPSAACRERFPIVLLGLARDGTVVDRIDLEAATARGTLRPCA